MTKIDISPSKLKKIGKIIADRAAQEDAELRPLSGRYRTSDRKALAKLWEKHVDGFTSLKSEFDALVARDEAKAEAQIKKLRAQALKIARSRKPDLDRMIAQQVQAFETLAHPAVQNIIPLWEPWEIASTGIDLDSWEIKISDSRAKFYMAFKKGTSLTATVVFKFVWPNVSDKHVVISASTTLSPRGFCDIDSTDHPVFENDYARIQMLLYLLVIDYTTEPYPMLGQALPTEVFSMSVEDGERETRLLFPGGDTAEVKTGVVLVPPGTTVGFHTTALMNVGTGEDSGKVTADFMSDAFALYAPVVAIEVLS